MTTTTSTTTTASTTTTTNDLSRAARMAILRGGSREAGSIRHWIAECQRVSGHGGRFAANDGGEKGQAYRGLRAAADTDRRLSPGRVDEVTAEIMAWAGIPQAF